jgi:hypothetical protein
MMEFVIRKWQKERREGRLEDSAYACMGFGL